MVKGVQRRMVEVRLRDSKIYESACLVLRTEAPVKSSGERELLDEANRIISSFEIGKTKKGDRDIFRKIVTGVLILMLGILIGFALGVLI